MHPHFKTTGIVGTGAMGRGIAQLATHRQYYEEPQYRPNVIAAQRLAGGVLGKKVGQGFYRYQDGAQQSVPEPAAPEVAAMPPVWVSPRAARRAQLLQLLKAFGGPASVLEVLFNLQTVYGDPRYRPSPWLRRRGAIGLSLLHEEE